MQCSGLLEAPLTSGDLCPSLQGLTTTEKGFEGGQRGPQMYSPECEEPCPNSTATLNQSLLSSDKRKNNES